MSPVKRNGFTLIETSSSKHGGKTKRELEAADN